MQNILFFRKFNRDLAKLEAEWNELNFLAETTELFTDIFMIVAKHMMNEG